MNRIKIRNLNQQRRHSWRTPRNKLEVAQRSQQRSATPLIILPVLALLKTKRKKQAVELVKHVRRSDSADHRNSLNHVFDCIVWSCNQDRGESNELRDAAIRSA